MTEERRDTSRPERRHTVLRRGGRRATDIPKDWLNVTDYAKRYGVGRDTVYKWLDAGLLDTYRVDDILRIRNLPPDEHSPTRKSVG